MTYPAAQVDYEGVIKLHSTGSNGDSLPPELPYSVTSIVDHRITLQEGDQVSWDTLVRSHSDSSQFLQSFQFQITSPILLYVFTFHFPMFPSSHI